MMGADDGAVADLDDRLIDLNAHLLYMLGKKCDENQDGTTSLEERENQGVSVAEALKSPPVPALQKKLEAAAELERSLVMDHVESVDDGDDAVSESSDEEAGGECGDTARRGLAVEFR